MSHETSLKNPEELRFPDIPENILFPDELCRYLRNQIQLHTRENSNLERELGEASKKLEAKTAKIKNLEAELKQYKDANDSVLALPAHVTSAKIVEISKKLREKCAELESIKTKYSRLENHFNKLKEKSNDEGHTQQEITETQELKKQIRHLQEKLNAATTKLTEVKTTNSQLKNDLKFANDFLEKETGENVALLQNKPDWKGKAQIIFELQSKNKELKERLKNLQDITQTKAKNSNKMQEILIENTELRLQIDDGRKKYDALKARNKILDAEIKQIRTKLAIINEHNEKDQSLITTLTAQMSSFEEVKKTMYREKDAALQKLKLEKDNLKSQLEHYKNVLKKLNEEQNKMKKEVSDSKNKTTEDNNFIISQAIEEEKKKLLNLLEIQNKRVQDERNLNCKIQEVLRLEKQRTAKLEAALAKNEAAEILESNRYGSLTSLKSQRIAENSLKDQLELAEESIKALATRLEIEQQERNIDLKEFSKILKNYKYYEETDKPTAE